MRNRGKWGKGCLIRYKRGWGNAQRLSVNAQEIEQRCVAMGDGEQGVANRKTQMPEKKEAPRTQQ